MAKSRKAKEEAVTGLTTRLKSARGIVFADFTGLVMKEVRELRATLRQAGVAYGVSKKTLLKRSLKDAGLDSVSVEGFKGSVSVATSATDEVEPAKLLAGFAKGHEKLQLLGGVIDGGYLDSTRVKELAKLPGKHELLGRLVGTVSAPLSGLVNVLQGNLRGLVQVLKAASQRGVGSS